MGRKGFVLAIAALCGIFYSGAQEKEVKRLDGSVISQVEIDETVKPLMVAAEVPGVGLALFNSGKIVYLNAYGVRDKEKKLPLTVDSIMSGASFSKVAFAYMVLQLADQQVLELDKPCRLRRSTQHPSSCLIQQCFFRSTLLQALCD